VRFGSCCSGVEAMSLASRHLGWKAAWLSEIEAFPSEVLAHHWPDVPNVGDMRAIPARIRSREMEAPPFFTGGTPCFTAGHLVLTEYGYRPLEHVRVGDLVMTHKGRLKPVLAVGSKLATVGEFNAVGIREPITVTPDHPFLSVAFRNQSTKRGNAYARVEHCPDPEWVKASEMPGRMWCAMTQYGETTGQAVSAEFDQRQAMYLAGMYLGDGHIREWKGKTKRAVILSLNPAKYQRMLEVVGEDFSHSICEKRSVVRVTINDTRFANWLEENFGRLAYHKNLPAWVLGHPLRAEILRGYLDTDGSKIKSGVQIATTSRSLAYGAADLLNAEGYSASVARIKVTPTKVIEGRTVNQREWFQVRGFDRATSRKSRVRHNYLLRSVTNFSEVGQQEVFNIEVADDNSYILNGVVVHNCQAFSFAGNRDSLTDARGALSLTFCEIADAIDDVRIADGDEPCIVQWENVPGCLSTDDNAFGCFLAGLAGDRDPIEPGPRPKPGRSSTHWRWKKDTGVHVPCWPVAGVVAGPRRTVAWRVVDAQYFGLAQRRERVFVVASARDGLSPGRILFESEGVRRDTAPSRKEAQDVACTIAGGSRQHGGYSTDDIPLTAGTLRAAGGGADVDHAMAGHLTVAYDGPTHTLRADGFDASEDGTGRGTPLIPVMVGTDTYNGKITGDVAATLGTRSGDGLSSGPSVMVPIAFDTYNQSVTGEITQTRCSRGDSPGGNAHLVPVIAFSCKDHGGDAGDAGDVAPTFRAMGHSGSHANAGGQVAVAFMADDYKNGTFEIADAARPLTTSADRSRAAPIATHGMAVRRLTPRECERLQGIHPDHTLIPIRKGKPKPLAKVKATIPVFDSMAEALQRSSGPRDKAYRFAVKCGDGKAQVYAMAADGPRYKAIGNSWAVLCVSWILDRVQREVDMLDARRGAA